MLFLLGEEEEDMSNQGRVITSFCLILWAPPSEEGKYCVLLWIADSKGVCIGLGQVALTLKLKERGKLGAFFL